MGDRTEPSGSLSCFFFLYLPLCVCLFSLLFLKLYQYYDVCHCCRPVSLYVFLFHSQTVPVVVLSSKLQPSFYYPSYQCSPVHFTTTNLPRWVRRVLDYQIVIQVVSSRLQLQIPKYSRFFPPEESGMFSDIVDAPFSLFGDVPVY